MREKKYHLYLTADEQSKVIQSLIDLKNNLIAQGRYTDAVDDVKDLEKRLLLKVFFCPNRSANGQDANYIIYRACQSG